MPFVDFSNMKGTEVGKPFKRELKVVMSPDTDSSIRDFSFIYSTLAPHGGCTDFHSHDRGELMIFVSGSGRAWLDGEEYELKPGVAMYAPAGVEHKTMNTGSEPLEIACVFVPAVSTDYILQNIEAARKAGEAE